MITQPLRKHATMTSCPRGFSGRLLKVIRQALSEHLMELCRTWEMIHGIA